MLELFYALECTISFSFDCMEEWKRGLDLYRGLWYDGKIMVSLCSLGSLESNFICSCCSCFYCEEVATGQRRMHVDGAELFEYGRPTH